MKNIWVYLLLWADKKKYIFRGIKKRIWAKLQGWKEKLLLQAGWEVLIKAVAQAIPNYTMSCFKLTKGFCREFESMFARFWGGLRGDERRVHWACWNRLYISKFRGWMGFKDFEAFKLALLEKEGWRLIHNTDSLFYKVF